MGYSKRLCPQGIFSFNVSLLPITSPLLGSNERFLQLYVSWAVHNTTAKFGREGVEGTGELPGESYTPGSAQEARLLLEKPGLS